MRSDATPGSLLVVVASVAPTLAFMAALSESKWSDALVDLAAPEALFDMRSAEAAVIASAMPAPPGLKHEALDGWMAQAARALAILRQNGAKVPAGDKLVDRCTSFCLALAHEATLCVGRLMRPAVADRIADLSLPAQILLADNLAHRFALLPYDQPDHWWLDEIETAKAEIERVSPGSAAGDGVPAILSLACMA